jgi:hypothetical protein
MTTAYDVVRGALRLIGVVTPIEPPSAEEAADGLSAMNQMLASWAASRYTSASVPQTSFALTSGVASYTIGAGGAINATRPTTIYQAHITQGGLDYPLRVVALGEYEAIPDKSTTGAIPEIMAIRPGYPLSTLHLYPAPGSGCTLVMDKIAPPSDLALYDTMPYPPEFIRAIRYNLAIELAPEYGVSVAAEIAKTASDALEVVRRVNLQIPAAVLDPLLMRRRGHSDINAIRSGSA